LNLDSLGFKQLDWKPVFLVPAEQDVYITEA
jgi:hypothetical protein